MLITIFLLLGFIFFLTARLWVVFNRQDRAEKELIAARELFKKEREKSVDLELSTTNQIVQELLHRPNCRFMLLLPHGKKDQNLNVEIHSSNIPLPIALGMLKATYQGVVQSLRTNDDIDDIDDDMDDDFEE